MKWLVFVYIGGFGFDFLGCRKVGLKVVSWKCDRFHFLGFRYFFLRFAVQKWVRIPIEDLADVALAIEDTDEDEENEEEEEDEGCANL